MDNAQAQLTLAKQNLAKTVIKAPFDAIVQSRNLNSFLFNLVDIGNQVTLSNPISGETYSAVINRFDPSIDKMTRTVGAYVDIQQPLSGAKPLLLETYLYADIVGKTFPQSMWIDNQASVENQFVWVKDSENRLKKVPFKLIYRGEKRSLVQFDSSVKSFIANPKDG